MVEPVLIPAIMSLAFQGIIGIISQIQHSRCLSIKCLGCECIRKVPTEDDDDNSTTTSRNPQETISLIREEIDETLTDNRQIPNTIE
tara:strand:+ start:4621 stop:4881 length:261 start_codon:yes stop_codon:yes gene_type:complete